MTAQQREAGLVDGLSGISDPYETPMDADLCIDTSPISVDDAIQQILAKLSVRDRIRLEHTEVLAWT